MRTMPRKRKYDYDAIAAALARGEKPEWIATAVGCTVRQVKYVGRRMNVLPAAEAPRCRLGPAVERPATLAKSIDLDAFLARIRVLAEREHWEACHETIRSLAEEAKLARPERWTHEEILRASPARSGFPNATQTCSLAPGAKRSSTCCMRSATCCSRCLCSETGRWRSFARTWSGC